MVLASFHQHRPDSTAHSIPFHSGQSISVLASLLLHPFRPFFVRFPQKDCRRVALARYGWWSDFLSPTNTRKCTIKKIVCAQCASPKLPPPLPFPCHFHDHAQSKKSTTTTTTTVVGVCADCCVVLVLLAFSLLSASQ